MKILVICQYYYPETFQINDICEQLVIKGHDITVLTGLPNYNTGVVPDEYKRGRKRDEYINGVHVLRCSERSRKKGKVNLFLNYISYVLSASIKINKLHDDYDLIFIYQLSPVFMGIPALKYSKKHNIPIFLYCCDIWPESIKIYIKNENSMIFKSVKRISKKIYNSCDKISVQSKSFFDYFYNVHNISENKTCYIPQFSDDQYLDYDFKTDNDVIDFVFLGNIGKAQNLSAVIEAIDKIRNIKNFKLHIVGDGSDLNNIVNLTNDKKLNDIVIIYGRKPLEEMQNFYSLADACILSLNADNLTGHTLPSKVQGYMAAGKPIFGMIDGSAREVIEEANCGVCVSPNDVNGFSEVLKDFIMNQEKYQNYGVNGRNYYIDNFKKDTIIKNIEDELKELNHQH